MNGEQIQLPVPEVSPAPISGEQFMEFTPEKFELAQGFLFDGPRDDRARRKLLALLLTNEGLAQALQLAPEEKWRAAMRQVFGKE